MSFGTGSMIEHGEHRHLAASFVIFLFFEFIEEPCKLKSIFLVTPCHGAE